MEAFTPITRTSLIQTLVVTLTVTLTNTRTRPTLTNTATSAAKIAPATDRPRRAPGVVDCDVRDEMLVYLPAGDQVVALNASARAVWELCDGRASITEMSETLGQRLGVPGQALLSDVRRAVSRMRALGLLEPPAA